MIDTKTKILDAAEHLTQVKGFNGFSYLDLVNEIGIKSSSIHYHFKFKDDLALALVKRIHETHSLLFNSLDKDLDNPQERLVSLIEFFQTYVQEQKFCMCGMMAAELQSVSPKVQKLIQAYFKDFRKWLKRQFELAGRENPDRLAIGFLSALEGSLLIGRLSNDPQIIEDALKDYLKP